MVARTSSGADPDFVRPLTRSRSEQLLARARSCYAGITSSMMKRPEQFALGEAPVYLDSGEGAVVRDVDGNVFIDFVCGLGANSLGHRHPAMEAAIVEQLPKGLLQSLPVELELEAAEAVVAAVPGAERVRFFKTGADATSAAVRVARAKTKREKVIAIGYNGWHDHFMFDTLGVPRAVGELTERFDLMDPVREPALLERLAASHVEPPAAVVLSAPYNRELGREFLLGLRKACDEVGSLLVFDEIVTGYRLALGGLGERTGVRPDLVCLSKALAAGLPLSALVGPAEHLAIIEKLQVSTTFGGECLSLAACVAAHSVYEKSNYFDHIAGLGRRLKAGVNERSERLGAPLRVRGYDPIPMFLFANNSPEHVPLAERFVGLMARRGILMRRDVNFLCAAHTLEQVDTTVEAAEDCLQVMRSEGQFRGSTN